VSTATAMLCVVVSNYENIRMSLESCLQRAPVTVRTGALCTYLHPRILCNKIYTT